ncbi:hypothetical protein QMK33_15955 [Hymenobacter sp. H14-R3]|uniref:hypothetical protein n=1 Tax=Hymenobacter sp. H14-R3 TaxID=3046308 RepID=UPI0024B905D9|nr:hypothetical protein [Hymenobacter sp. H14-R3]MDJ0366652.1 hypothetical protein [Hymenobacter sp. H14-R3]
MKMLLLLATAYASIITAGATLPPNPRTAEMHKLHEYVLAKGKHITGQISGSPTAQVQASQQDFTKLMKQSTATLLALDQLDHAATLTSTQLATQEKLFKQEGSTLGTANNVLARTANLLQEARDKASMKALMGGK